MTRRLTPMLLMAALVLIPTQARSFDGDRNGFILGVGAGYGVVRNHSDNEGGLATAFKIGGGPTNNLLLYYSARAVFYDSRYTWGMNAVAFSYFLKSSAPSVFFTGEAGLTARMYNTGGRMSDPEMGFAVGIGFEFSPHYLLEANFMALEQSVRAVSLTVSWLAF